MTITRISAAKFEITTSVNTFTVVARSLASLEREIDSLERSGGLTGASGCISSKGAARSLKLDAELLLM